MSRSQIPAGDYETAHSRLSAHSDAVLKALHDAATADRSVSFAEDAGPRLVLVDQHVAAQATACFFLQRTSALLVFRDVRLADPMALIRAIAAQTPGRELVVIAPHAVLARSAAFLLYRDVNR